MGTRYKSPELALAARVAQEGECLVWTGAVSCLYGKIWDGKRLVAVHRFAWAQCNGDIAAGMEIDHMCLNKLCVEPTHLRMVTRKQNLENKAGANKNSKSGVRGVWRSKNGRKWLASVRHNGKKYNLGPFDSLEDADYAVTKKRNELFTHNDPDKREHQDLGGKPNGFQ